MYTYPIKSCARLEHDHFELDVRGPMYDRHWMVVSDAPDDRGMFLTQRELSPLAVVQPAFEGNDLRISAPGMADIRVPLIVDESATLPVVVWKDDCQAVDNGPEAAAWLSDYLGVPARLVHMPPGYVRPVDPKYATEPAQASFADGYPLLITQQSSLDELNRRIVARGKAAVPMSRFRPNVVVEGDEADNEPFSEDDWRRIEIGVVPFDVVKACARCVTTTVDQNSGTVPDHTEPLATLNTFRKIPRGVLFGQNMIHRALGEIAVGDAVQVLEAVREQ